MSKRYLESHPSILHSQTLILSLGPHEERVHNPQKPTLLYLPYFILPQHLAHLRRLYIHWNLSPAGEGESDTGLANETKIWWDECWRFLATLQGLNELLVKFQCRDGERRRGEWEALQSGLGEVVRRVKVRRRFVVVLPFLGRGEEVDVGESGCEVRVPDQGGT